MKHTQDLGAGSHAVRFKDPNSDERIEKYENQMLERLRQPVPVAEEYEPYFGSYMHDSYLQRVSLEKDEFVISLHNDAADEFARALAVLLEVERPIVQYRIDLRAHGVVYMNTVQEEDSGKLRWADMKDLRAWPSEQCDSFISDWFHTQEGRIQWVVEISAFRRERGRCGFSRHYLVDCESVSALDLRELGLAKAFTPAVVPLWQDAMKMQADWEYNWQWRKILEERIPARGISLESLRPPT